MNFAFSDEQAAFRETLRRFLAVQRRARTQAPRDSREHRDEGSQRRRGIALDKVARYEGWGTARDPKAAASAVIERLAALEGKVKLEVTLGRSTDAIDVTPSKTGA